MKEAELFDGFIESLGQKSPELPAGERQKTENIVEESELLKEIKDVLDELNIINAVILAQQDVLSKVFRFLDDASGRKNSRRMDRREQSTDEKSLSDMVSFYQRMGKFDAVKGDVDKLIYDATKTQYNVSSPSSVCAGDDFGY